MKKLSLVLVVLMLVAFQSVTAQKTSDSNANFLTSNSALFDELSYKIAPQLRVLADSLGSKSLKSIGDFLNYRIQTESKEWAADYEVKSENVYVMCEITDTYSKLWIDYDKKELFVMSSSQDYGTDSGIELLFWKRNALGKAIDIEGTTLGEKGTKKTAQYVDKLPR